MSTYVEPAALVTSLATISAAAPPSAQPTGPAAAPSEAIIALTPPMASFMVYAAVATVAKAEPIAASFGARESTTPCTGPSASQAVLTAVASPSRKSRTSSSPWKNGLFFAER